MLARLISPANPLLACRRTSWLRLQSSAVPPLSLFSTTCSHFDNTPPNHYEVLNVSPDCTHAELKKQFYALSRVTHPDINRNDPNASTRFSQVSESYSVLADPEKRRRYDRDFFRAQQSSSSSSSRTPGHTGSYAGSRPPSGLSKRRGVFRGPPPSFYAQGGYTSSASSSASSSSSTASKSEAAPSGEPEAEFDPTTTYKTQTHEDARRQNRRRTAAMAAAQADMEDDSDFWTRFAVVLASLVGTVGIASIFASGATTHKRAGGLTRADGSERGGPANAWTKG